MKKRKKIIIALIVIVLIISIVIILILKNKKSKDFEGPQLGDNGEMRQFMKEDMGEENEYGNMLDRKDNDDSNEMPNKDDKQFKNTTTLKTTTEIKSALTEDIELHATYYLEEVYVEENDFVEEGANILKYTNGIYLVAPYDCYIISLNIPDLEGKILNSHYVEISSSNSLMVTMNIDETNIEDVDLGLEAKIEISSLDKTYTGNVTHIASTGSGGSFEIEIEFENDGDIKIGMTGTVSITI